MPDGAVVSLLELPAAMDVTTAWKELDSYGLCKIGGDIVPIIYSRQLPERSLAAPVVEVSTGGTQPADLAPTSEPQGGGIVGMVAGSIVLLAIAAGVVAYSRRKPKPIGAGAAGPAQAAPEAKAPPKAKAPGRTDTRRSALDDLLGGE